MSGWGRDLEDLTRAVAELLAVGPMVRGPLVDVPAALAARDAVVGEVRALVGMVQGAGAVPAVGEVTVRDVVERPAWALSGALAMLDRAGLADGGPAPTDVPAGGLGVYEQLWQRAGRASVWLERSLETVDRLPGGSAWRALRDLADVAAALPHLDSDLADAARGQLAVSPAGALSWEALTADEAHSAVRICAEELRARLHHLPGLAAVDDWLGAPFLDGETGLGAPGTRPVRTPRPRDEARAGRRATEVAGRGA